MARYLTSFISLSIVLLFATVNVQAFPFGWPRDVTASGDRVWSFWSWIWAPDSTVSVVDRENPVTFIARPASFGGELKHPLLGYVIPLSSFTTPCPNSTLTQPGNWGCSPLCQSGKNSPSPTEPWIALVQRGHCSFADKAREAQRLGAKAVVVGGDDPTLTGHSDSLVSMYDPDASLDIMVAATFIKFSDYVILSSLINSSETIHSGLRTVSLLVGADTPAGGWLSPAITFITILLLPSFLTFITLVIHRFRMVRAARRERAPEDIVHRLPWRVWTGTGWEKHDGSEPPPTENAPVGDLEAGSTSAASGSPTPPTPEPRRPGANRATSSNSATTSARAPAATGEGPSHPWADTQFECAICLSEFEVGDRVRVLPCDHIFHMDEVDGWLIHNKKLCPVCKADVTQPPVAYVPSDERSRGRDREQPETDGAVTEPTEATPLLGSR